MKERIIEQLKIGWRMQHLQFEYLSHAKTKIVGWYFFVFFLLLYYVLSINILDLVLSLVLFHGIIFSCLIRKEEYIRILIHLRHGNVSAP